MSGRRLTVVAALAVAGALGLPGSAAAQVPAPPDPTCSPAPADCHAWHTAAVVTVTWASPPPGVIAEGCDPKTITVDTAGTVVSCTWWSSDFSAFKTTGVSVRRDATPPSIDVRPSRGPDSNGWYNRPLAVDFAGADAMSGLAGCSPTKAYPGPDSGVASVTGTCADQAGNARTGTFTFQYDATPPAVTARPARDPDRKGWYNRKVTVDFVGSDATSGVGSCAPSVTYAGPDASKTSVAGTCTDRAANTSAAAAYELRFDTRPPVLAWLKAAAGRDGIALRWRASADASSFAVVRRPGLDGRGLSTLYTGPKASFVDGRVAEGTRYRYTVTASDDAGNTAVKGQRMRAVEVAAGSGERTARTGARPALLRPAAGARLGVPPVLAWDPVAKATYYNVQLFRNGKKILTAWPAGESFRLQRSWTYDGRAQRLTPGTYRWYVWPGFGKRSASTYGKLLGTRTFVVTRG